MKQFAQLFAGITLSLMAFMIWPKYFFRWFGDSPSWEKYLYLSTPVAALVVTWLITNKRRPALYETVVHSCKFIISCFMAYLFIYYAMGKLMQLQFYTPPEILNQQLGQVDNSQLLWSALDRSTLFEWCIGLFQIIIAVLLFFNRSRFTGALLYFIIHTNIVLICFAYGIVYMQFISVLVLFMNLFLLWFDASRIVRFLGGNATMPVNYSPLYLNKSVPRLLLIPVVVAALSIAESFYFFYTTAIQMKLI